MPRVTEAHLAARRQQILEAAWRCFARNGFHGTSMQDIFEESGLSAGAIYRYFPGKIDLVQATAESVTGDIAEVFDLIDAIEPVPDPPATFRLVIERIVSAIADGEVDRSRIAVHVWSEALREPQVGVLAREVGRAVRDRWVPIAARWRAAGHMPADSDPAEVARLMYGLMVGFVLQRQLLGDITPAQYLDGFSSLFRGGEQS
ncbi:TetR/AcrR family transcriptional regulator [Phytoactinopolyspora mesophila]|nr:TetR/AcrR family transcriptional regulator [Phytoactinopolyspora mesophila]